MTKHYNISGKILKALVYVLIVATTAFLIVPIIFTIIGSFCGYWGKTMFSRGFTLQWYEYVFYYYGHTIGLTLIITCATVVINAILGSMTAYKLAMHPNKKSKLIKFLEEVLTLPAAIPGIAIGLALAQTYPDLRRSGVLILIGHVIFTFPLMFRAVTGALRAKDFKSIDECASTLGAGPLRKFFLVIMPAIRVSIMSGAVNVFMQSLGEFNITFFLYTPFIMTLPVGMYESYASLRIEVGSAFTTLFLAFAIPLTYLLNRLNKTKTK